MLYSIYLVFIMKKYALLLWIFTLFWLHGFVVAWPWCSIAPVCSPEFKSSEVLYPLEQYAFDAEQCQLSQWNTVIHAYLEKKKLRLVDNQSLALRDALNGMKNTLEKEMKQYYATIATWPLSLKQMQSFPKFKRWYILSYAVSYIDSAQKIWCYDESILDQQNAFLELEALIPSPKPVEPAQLISSLVYVLPLYQKIYSWSTLLWWEINGFWIRFTARDRKSNAINPIVTITPPYWSCVHFYSGSLPMDFVEIKPVWWSRIQYNSRVKTQTPLNQKDMHVTYCGIEKVKIVMPKESNFFMKNAQGMWSSAPFGLWFTAPKNEVLRYPSCGEIVYSADNAQYSETNFCVQKQIQVKNYQYLQFIEDAVKDWLVTLQ
jgi:hypothetical protein